MPTEGIDSRKHEKKKSEIKENKQLGRERK
jgi:hypothetical protein